MATDDRLYFAKSTTPGIPWRGQWATRHDAEEQAGHFVLDWQSNGVSVTATVFYRDGSAVSHHKPQIEPDANLDREYHDQRGDN